MSSPIPDTRGHKRTHSTVDLTVRFPPIKDWLASLDSHPTRSEADNSVYYRQHAPAFKDAGLTRLDDLLDVNEIAQLRELVNGLNWGTAKRLLKFVKEDAKELTSAAKRARRE